MLKVKNLNFAYAEKNILQNISFAVKKGEHLSIIGESGCGKSTLLKAIYGLLDLDQGEILFNDKKVLGPAYNLVPGEPEMKYLAQEEQLMPFTSVAENITEHLSRQFPKENEERLAILLEVVDMKAYANTKVKLLSGGQKQRVALAQVLAKKPELLLLDEAFNFIDNFRKNKLRRRLFSYLQKENISCIFATHDSTDLFGFADKTIVLREGKILTKNAPKNLLKNPPDFYTASLLSEVNRISSVNLKSSQNGYYLIYPQELHLRKDGFLSVKVEKSYYNGFSYFVEAILKNIQEKLYFYSENTLKKGETCNLAVAKALLDKRFRKE
ncbi:ABC transporter ATP-binding protein [Haloflavibacter putidus]|uniref:ABC transporter ATP-binding protein n=1 Tax=Haloflavibacter putidus TaxID=2576776 RepID=A0A508A157_9FLAO|nr:ABC transporter ATP-binding protein [Haloflavibacter putidus]TQD40675.1 ABC transporter ATP-binding protein [Haloflavibacter putidus]